MQLSFEDVKIWIKKIMLLRLNSAMRAQIPFIPLSYNGSVGKEPACHEGDTGDVGLIPGLGRSPGEGNGNPLQNSCLENPMIRGARRATVQRVTKSRTQLSD